MMTAEDRNVSEVQQERKPDQMKKGLAFECDNEFYFLFQNDPTCDGHG